MADDPPESGDTAGLVPVRLEPLAGDADAAARLLVEHGVGARVEPAPRGVEVGYEVLVLPEDAARAAFVLGDAEPGEAADDLDDWERDLYARRPAWQAAVAIGLAALIVLPTVVGFVTYLLLTR